MANDIALHHRCLRSSLMDCGGYEVATEGDSFKVAFHTPGAPHPLAAIARMTTPQQSHAFLLLLAKARNMPVAFQLQLLTLRLCLPHNFRIEDAICWATLAQVQLLAWPPL